MRRWTALLLVWILLLSLLAGCSSQEQTVDQPDGEQTEQKDPQDREEPVELDTFALELRGISNGAVAQTLQALEPLGQKLKTLLAEEGYSFSSVQVTLGASPRTTGEALSDGTIDAAIVNIETYIRYAAGLPVLMTSAPESVNLEVRGGAWNVSALTEQMPWQTVQICAGSSNAGLELAEMGKRSFESMAAVKWAVPRAGRELDYLNLWLWDNYGKTVADLPYVEEMDTVDELVFAGATGAADVVVLTAETDGGMMLLGSTTRFYDMALVAGTAREELDCQEFRSALVRAVTNLCADEDGMQLLRQLGCAEPLVAIDDFDDADLLRMMEVMGGSFTCDSWE